VAHGAQLIEFSHQPILAFADLRIAEIAEIAVRDDLRAYCSKHH
jgi:hypothetical protein